MITPKLKSEEVYEGQKLIANFMSLHIKEVNYGNVYCYGDNVYLPNELEYYKSWDWIMPVIDKINGLGKEFSFAIFKTYVSLTVEKGGKMYKDFSFAYSEYITAEQTGLEAAFKLVIKFLDWYYKNLSVKNLVYQK